MTAFRAQLPYITFRFSGDDACTFLQGQLTQDISKIPKNHCQYGAYCNHKGQMLANFLIANDGTGYILRLHEAMSESVIKRLEMFMLRSKVTTETLNRQTIGLNQTGAEYFCEQLGLPLPSTFSSISSESFLLCALPHGWYELNIDADTNYQDILAEITENNDDITALRLQGGHFNVLPETNESLSPQQTTLEEMGAIDYKKGCYVGQEIIARNKYRGKRTKAMAFAIVESPIELTVPAYVLLDGKKVGQIIEYHRTSSQTICLAILSIDSFGQNTSIVEQDAVFSAIK